VKSSWILRSRDQGIENKLRSGGVTHAARGFWAVGVPFRAAVILSEYLIDLAQEYFRQFGCVGFDVLGVVSGAPNVTVILDATEVADQGYETLLREEKSIRLYIQYMRLLLPSGRERAYPLSALASEGEQRRDIMSVWT
jgi:hypothetical protein